MAIIGSLADVVASDLADDFAAPSRIADTSWIKPGRVAWSWWSDSWQPAPARGPARLRRLRRAQGFEYVLVDAGWNAGWVPALVDYAAERGVRVLLWTDWHALATPAQRAEAFDQWAAWGVAGVKADFLHSDSGERMAVIDDIARRRRRAPPARRLPRLHRPARPAAHVAERDDARGRVRRRARQVRPRRQPGAQNVTLAFTRNVIGSMDYTPVTFSAPGASERGRRSSRSRSSTSPGCSTTPTAPAATRRRPAALELLREVPAAWDDTRLLAGAPARSVTLARRSGERWFVGSLSAHRAHARRPSTSASWTRGAPTPPASTPTTARDGIAVTERRVYADTRLTLALARHGGFAIVLTPA